MDACGLPGPVMGGINMFLGHSNSSKTTAMILAAADAQRRGDLPVLIITEKKWSWKHAVELGLQAEQDEDGNWDGHFIYNDSFDYIEQLTDYMNDILDAQANAEPYKLIKAQKSSRNPLSCKVTCLKLRVYHLMSGCTGPELHALWPELYALWS